METAQPSNSFESLLLELKGPLTRFTLSLGLSVPDAEDAVQTGFIALTRAIEKNPASIRNPKAYAFTIVRNNANKIFRDRTRRNEVEIPENLPVAEEEPDDLQEPSVREAFTKAYENLSDSERSLLHKYYVLGWTYDRIGQELECSAQNVWKSIKKITSTVLAGEVRKTLSRTDPELANKLFNR